MTNSLPPSRPRRRDDMVFRPVADEWVIYDPVTRRLHALNLTAALVWSHCDGAHDLDALVEGMREAFDPAPPEGSLRRDVRDALVAFAREGLLR